jgi:hypothetical protein
MSEFYTGTVLYIGIFLLFYTPSSLCVLDTFINKFDSTNVAQVYGTFA